MLPVLNQFQPLQSTKSQSSYLFENDSENNDNNDNNDNISNIIISSQDDEFYLKRKPTYHNHNHNRKNSINKKALSPLLSTSPIPPQEKKPSQLPQSPSPPLNDQNEHIDIINNIWKQLLHTYPIIGEDIIKLLINDELFSKSIKMYCEQNNLQINELSKHFTFWFSSCLSKLNEPFIIQDTLQKLESLLNISLKTFDTFNNIVSGEIIKHIKTSSKTFLSHWSHVSDRLKLFLCSPACEKCKQTMIRKIPNDIKKINGNAKCNRGVNLQKETWIDTIPLCKKCNHFLFYEDIYFECLSCGPQAYRRYVKSGKLFNVVHDNQGSSLCLSCLQHQQRQQQLQQKKRQILQQQEEEKKEETQIDNNNDDDKSTK